MIKPVEEREYYSASSAQKRLFILNQLEEISTSYNMPGAILIEGEFDQKRLEYAFNTLVERHESFRTSFEMMNGELIQRIHKNIDFQITYMELGSQSSIEAVIKEFIRPFDLNCAPLLRVGLIKITDQRHILVFDMHHIISDGASMDILVKEISSLFNGKDLPDLKIQYKDFSIWQNDLFNSEKIKKQEEYWLQNFADELPILNMPTDHLRPPVMSFKGDELEFVLDEKVTARLNKLCNEKNVTSYMVLLAAYNVLLSKYSGQEDIIVGSPIAGRSNLDLENIIGMFVNTLAMRNYPTGEKRFAEFLDEVKENATKSYENQDYQFEMLVEKLDLQKNLNRNPLFDVVFSLQNGTGYDHLDLGDLKFIPYEIENKVAKFDLTLTAVDSEKVFYFTLNYSTDLYEKETIERMANHLANIVRQIVENPMIEIGKIQMISAEERDQLLFKFNDTQVNYPKDKTLIELFEEQVRNNPENIALIYQDQQLSYRELNQKSNQLARVLIGKAKQIKM